MKRSLQILLTILLLFIFGCARSIIKISAKLDEEPFQMFGKTPQREFYVPVTVSDSLNLVWENSTNGSFPNSSIAIYDQYVFVNDLSGRIYCYEIENGKQVGKIKNKGAIYSTPTPFKTLLFVPVAIENDPLTELVFYDYQNGKEVDIVEIPGRVITESLPIEDEVIFCTELGGVYRYNLIGGEIWQTQTRVPIRSSPSLYENLVLFGNDAGEILALDANTGDSVYVSEIGGNFFSGSSIVDGTMFIGNNSGSIYAIDAATGEMLWEFNSGARIAMTPAVDDNIVIFGNLAGSLYSLNKFNGEINWETKFGSVLNTTPLLTNNRIILPDVFFAFHLIDKENGEIKKTFPLEGRAKLTPVYYRDLLFVGYDNGILRAYEFIK